jgi:hypothetical protein
MDDHVGVNEHDDVPLGQIHPPVAGFCGARKRRLVDDDQLVGRRLGRLDRCGAKTER